MKATFVKVSYNLDISLTKKCKEKVESMILKHF